MLGRVHGLYENNRLLANSAFVGLIGLLQSIGRCSLVPACYVSLATVAAKNSAWMHLLTSGAACTVEGTNRVVLRADHAPQAAIDALECLDSHKGHTWGQTAWREGLVTLEGQDSS